MTSTVEKKTNNKLTFPDFDDIPVSTKTFIVMTNMILDIEKMFNSLPITDYIVIPKKRGRKKKNEPEDPNKNIPSGSIITLEYIEQRRGVNLKKNKSNISSKTGKKKSTYFRNSVTVVMIVDGKKINFKVSRNGKFQMTGCKYDKHAERCVLYIWNYIKCIKDIYTMRDFESELKVVESGDKSSDKSDEDSVFEDSDSETDEDEKESEIPLTAMFIPAMRNIDFSLNFIVDREKLDEYFNVHTEYHSLLETSFGYTGVNIKFPMIKNIKDLQLKQLKCVDKDWTKPTYVSYMSYLNLLPQKERDKKLKKERYNTFLVFHSGKIIYSGLEASYMRETYYKFLDIILECKDEIEEKLDTD